MTRREFLRWRHKALSLIGLSADGRSEVARRFPQSTWFHYSSDYRIGTRYLDEPILDNVKRQAMQVGFLRDLLRSDSIYIANNIKIHNLEPIEKFLGAVGREDLGGLPREEFRRRQRLHRTAEVGAMRDVPDFIEKSKEIYGYDHFLNDTSDSFCDLDDDTIELVATHTLIVYLRPGEARKVRRRETETTQGPIRFNEEYFDVKLAEYMRARCLDSVESVVPQDFRRWILAGLGSRWADAYQRIADTRGYTVEASAAKRALREGDLLNLIASVL